LENRTSLQKEEKCLFFLLELSSMLKKYGIWISAALVIVGILLFYFGTRSVITVTVDGIDRTVLSHGFTVGSALASAKIPFYTEDRVLPAINSLLPKSGKIQVITAKPVHILVQPGNVWVQVYSADDIPGNILLETGLRLFPGDEIYYNGFLVSASEKLPWHRISPCRYALPNQLPSKRTVRALPCIRGHSA